VIVISLVDNGANWGGNYDLYLKVQRVGPGSDDGN
jgi:hypothetical protein